MNTKHNFLRSMPARLNLAQRAAGALACCLVFSLAAAACSPSPASIITVTPLPAVTSPPPVVGSPTPAFQGTPVPFMTIERAELAGTGGDYEGFRPKIEVLTGAGDIQLLGQSVSEQARQALLQVDFDRYAVIGVFQGTKPTNRYGVQILQVTRTGDRFTVYAELLQPPRNIELSDVVTSPYELVQIPQEGLSDSVQVDLVVEGEVIGQAEVGTPTYQGMPVPFETIDREETPGTGGNYQGLEPRLVVLTGAAEIESLLGETISVQARTDLHQVNFGQSIVIGLFQGRKPTNLYHVNILQVTRVEQRLMVYAELLQPPPNTELAAMETSPYELIRIDKEGLSPPVQVDLVANGEPVPIAGTTVHSFLQTTPSSYDPSYTPPAPTLSPTLDPTFTNLALEYLVTKYNVTVEDLIVHDPHRRDYPNLKKSYWIVNVLDEKTDNVYLVLVDMADGSITEDIVSVDRAEREAAQSRYGKFEPALYERLQSMQPDDTVTVAIWVAGEPRRSEQERYEALAEMFPEVREALQRSGNPFDVGDQELSMQIRRESMRLEVEDNLELVSPFAERLASMGYDPVITEALPSVIVTLPKHAILELESDPSAGMIYLADQVEQTGD